MPADLMEKRMRFVEIGTDEHEAADVERWADFRIGGCSAWARADTNELRPAKEA